MSTKKPTLNQLDTTVKDYIDNAGFDGDYNSLINKPSIPTTTSQLTNDSNFETTEGSQAKATTAETNSNTYTDGKVTELDNKMGLLQELNTTEKASLVGAINEVNGKEFARRNQEDWVNTVLQNGWKTVSGYKPLQYFKDEFGIVHLTGIVVAPSNHYLSTIATLPVGYRPSKNIIIPTGIYPDKPSGSVRINSDGTIQNLTVTTDGNYISINVLFRVD